MYISAAQTLIKRLSVISSLFDDLITPPNPNHPNAFQNERRPEDPIIISLSQGKLAFVSQVDRDLAEKYRWHFGATKGYAQRQIREGKKKRYEYLHRKIAERMINRDLTSNDFVEYSNGDRLDNRRENILILTRSEHIQKQNISKSNKSGYKGVFYRKSRNKWEARITIHGKKIFLGLYDNRRDAAIAYNQEARKYYGENAKLNDILLEDDREG
jgi:hypothetical protein